MNTKLGFSFAKNWSIFLYLFYHCYFRKAFRQKQGVNFGFLTILFAV